MREWDRVKDSKMATGLNNAFLHWNRALCTEYASNQGCMLIRQWFSFEVLAITCLLYLFYFDVFRNKNKINICAS